MEYVAYIRSICISLKKSTYVISDVDIGGNVSMNSNSFFVSRGRQGKNQVATTEVASGRLEADSPVIVSLADEIQSSTPSKSGRGGILSPTPLPPSSPSLSSPSVSHRYNLVINTLHHSSEHSSGIENGLIDPVPITFTHFVGALARSGYQGQDASFYNNPMVTRI